MTADFHENDHYFEIRVGAKYYIVPESNGRLLQEEENPETPEEENPGEENPEENPEEEPQPYYEFQLRTYKIFRNVNENEELVSVNFNKDDIDNLTNELFDVNGTLVTSSDHYFVTYCATCGPENFGSIKVFSR